jgi:hypothetical protein
LASDKCVRLFHVPVTYNEAESSCVHEGGDLVNILRNSQIDKVLIHDLDEPFEKTKELGLNDYTWFVGGLQAALANPQLAYDLWLTTSRIQQERKRSLEKKVLALQKNTVGHGYEL